MVCAGKEGEGEGEVEGEWRWGWGWEWEELEPPESTGKFSRFTLAQNLAVECYM